MRPVAVCLSALVLHPRALNADNISDQRPSPVTSIQPGDGIATLAATMTVGTALATRASNLVMRNYFKTAGRSDWLTLTLMFATLVLIIGVLRWAREILIPITLAVLLTFILAPVENR